MRPFLTTALDGGTLPNSCSGKRAPVKENTLTTRIGRNQRQSEQNRSGKF